MKRFISVLTILIFISTLTISCTKNQRAKRWGGTMEYSIPENEEFVNATWKDDNLLWIITKSKTSTTFYMHEVSNFGLMEGTVVIRQ